MTAGDAAEMVQRLLGAWDARDPEALAGCLADEVEWYDPAMPDPRGRSRRRLRPTPGSWRAWLAVAVQRVLAWAARITR